MSRRSVARPRVIAAIWSGLCLVAMLVGFATLTSQPSGDFLDAAASPALTDGDVAVVVLAIWLCGLALLLVGVGLARLWRRFSRPPTTASAK